MFERTLQIIGKDTLNCIQNKSLLLVGVGGVGGFALEAFVRTGFKNITIVDHDTIDETNLNRQIIANRNNIGKLKVEEAKIRCLAINPEVQIETISLFLNEENIYDIFSNKKYDYIIDACDTITTKYLLIKHAIEKNIPIISSMGTGNRLDPAKLEITTLDKTNNDPLSKALRSILRKNHISLKIPVIWSKEMPIKTQTRSPGSMIMVPGVSGLLINAYILQDIQKAAK